MAEHTLTVMRVCDPIGALRHFIAGEEHDTEVTKCDFQFRANILSCSGNTYLRVSDDGSVHIDGKEDQRNTIFHVAHVFPPQKNYYQIVSKDEDYVLYVDETNNEKELKARPYKSEDSLNGGYSQPKPTLFKFHYENDSDMSISTLTDTHYHFTQDSTEHSGNSRIVLSKNPGDDISFEIIKK